MTGVTTDGALVPGIHPGITIHTTHGTTHGTIPGIVLHGTTAGMTLGTTAVPITTQVGDGTDTTVDIMEVTMEAGTTDPIFLAEGAITKVAKPWLAQTTVPMTETMALDAHGQIPTTTLLLAVAPPFREPPIAIAIAIPGHQ